MCKHCYKRYYNNHFLLRHIHTAHLPRYVLFVQQRFKFLKYKKTLSTLKARIIRKRFLKLKETTNKVKKIYLQHLYTPGRTGYKRVSKSFHGHL